MEELQRGCPQTQKNWTMRERDAEKDEGSCSEQKLHTMNVIGTLTHEFWPQEFFVTLQVSLGGCFFNILVCFSTRFLSWLRFACEKRRRHSDAIRTTNLRNAQSRAVHCESQESRGLLTIGIFVHSNIFIFDLTPNIWWNMPYKSDYPSSSELHFPF